MSILNAEATRFASHIEGLVFETRSADVNPLMLLVSVERQNNPRGDVSIELKNIADGTVVLSKRRATEMALHGCISAVQGSNTTLDHVLRGDEFHSDRNPVRIEDVAEATMAKGALTKVVLSAAPESQRAVVLDEQHITMFEPMKGITIVMDEYRPTQRIALIWKALSWASGNPIEF